MDGTGIFLIGFVIFCFFMAIYKLVDNGSAKKQMKQTQQASSQFTPEQLKFLQTVGTLFKENRVVPLLQVYEECGIPHEIAYSKNPAIIDKYIPFDKGSSGENVFMTYALAVNNRYLLKNTQLVEHSNDIFNLNLRRNEKIYHVIYSVILYQEKTTVTNFAYSGFRWSSGPLRFGNLNVITNEITRFSPVDSGNLIFTNERLIFLGKQKNITKQVDLSNILYNNMYQDGVMVHIPNQKPLLFKFSDYKDFEIYQIADSINEFAIVFDRLLNGTYMDDMDNSQQPILDESLDVIEALKRKGYNPEIAEIISLAEFRKPITTYKIMSKFCMGHNRAEKLMEEMERLKFVSNSINGERMWFISPDENDLILLKIKEAEPLA